MAGGERGTGDKVRVVNTEFTHDGGVIVWREDGTGRKYGGKPEIDSSDDEKGDWTDGNPS